MARRHINRTFSECDACSLVFKCHQGISGRLRLARENTWTSFSSKESSVARFKATVIPVGFFLGPLCDIVAHRARSFCEYPKKTWTMSGSIRSRWMEDLKSTKSKAIIAEGSFHLQSCPRLCDQLCFRKLLACSMLQDEQAKTYCMPCCLKRLPWCLKRLPWCCLKRLPSCWNV